MSKWIRLALVVSCLFLLSTGTPALSDELPPGGTFWDDDGTPEEGHIEAISAIDVTRGCNPPINDLFCPDRALTRGEMATIFVRGVRSSMNSSSRNSPLSAIGAHFKTAPERSRW